ncbi:MAG: hypothetical protein PHV20_09355 [Bacteroidales bacterium]|nr:hypothetical protein [Bacteroidales bacterium]
MKTKPNNISKEITILNKLVFFLCIGALMLFVPGCDISTSTTSESTSQVSTSQLTCATTDDIDYDINIMDDRSGSGLDIVKPDTSFYLKIAKHFSTLGSTCISAIVAGNPTVDNRSFIRLYLMKPLVIPGDAILSEQAKYRKENIDILAKNNKETCKWIQLIDQRIIHYQPDKNSDLTRLQDPIDKAYRLMTEPNFSKSKKILIIISDLVNEPTHPGKVESFNNKFDEIEGLKLISVGARNPNIFIKVKDYQNFESIDGVLHFLLTINNNF